ncbi:hypothetical protein BofuT4_P063690.1 [Botrytis cinerea T4]|uniref:FAD/NAD(P)-binding domain-containing protein n=1 Tax=Botryotinia fuckeliana (strain T4) TaxID=999810 RepID=G2XSP9_BOTF4|nr:hypothetical protein BofuT4_P063690.1 [Botrytis cinerea T4]
MQTSMPGIFAAGDCRSAMKIVSNALSTGAAGGSGVSHSDTPNLSELWQRASSNKTGARKRLQKGNLRFSAMATSSNNTHAIVFLYCSGGCVWRTAKPVANPCISDMLWAVADLSPARKRRGRFSDDQLLVASLQSTAACAQN